MKFTGIGLVFLFFFVFFSCETEETYSDFLDSKDPIVDVPKMPVDFTVTETTTKTLCIDGFAGEYPCNGYDLMARIPLYIFKSEEANDSWGWTDSDTAKEYAIIGLNDGTGFVDISDPVNPVYLGKLPTATESSSWRDIKVYKNYAYIVSEAKDHGVQVFDLTKLRGLKSVQNFTSDGVVNIVKSAHNIFINEESGFGYVVGTNRENKYDGGVYFLDLADPLNPLIVGGYGERGYTHDAQIVNYKGPDADYLGKEIYIGSNESNIIILDVTDKKKPTFIASIVYQNLVYTHQGWFTEDQRFFIMGDEGDEYTFGGRTRSLVFDLEDLDNPVLHFSYLGATNAIDHNGYVINNLLYLANYTAGIRVIDVKSVENKQMSEVGYFDTYPKDNSSIFAGVWNVYPFFESGVILISDLNKGLFLVKKSE